MFFATVGVNCCLNAGMSIPSVLIVPSGIALSIQSSMLLYEFYVCIYYIYTSKCMYIYKVIVILMHIAINLLNTLSNITILNKINPASL